MDILAIHPDWLRQRVDVFNTAGEKAVSFFGRNGLRHNLHSRIGNVSLIEIAGPLMKSASPLLAFLTGATMHDDILAAIGKAEADSVTDTVLLLIDSPGGTVAGTAANVDAIRRLSKRKRVVAFSPDLMTSGAYWLASGAGEIYVGRSCLAGSIGVLMSVTDRTGLEKQLGIVTHSVRSVPRKAPAAGPEITPENIADIQGVVDGFHSQFSGDVQTGRKLSAAGVEKIATGETWIGEQAVRAGLADSVKDYSQLLSELTTARPATPKPPARPTVRGPVAAADSPAPAECQASRDFVRMQLAHDNPKMLARLEGREPAPVAVAGPTKPDRAKARRDWEEAIAVARQQGARRPAAWVAEHLPDIRAALVEAFNTN